MTILFSRTDQSVLGRWWWTVDRTLLASSLALIVIGIVMVTTASPSVALRIAGPGHEYMFIHKHLLYLVPTVLLMFGVSMLSPRAIWRIACVAIVFCIVSLVIVLVSGEEIKGARRWIEIFHIFSFQPSEFVKPAFAIVAAWIIARKKDQPSQPFPAYRIVLALYVVILVLLAAQPDVGMSVVLTCMFGAILFLAGLSWKWIGGLAASGAALLGLAYLFMEHFRVRMDKFLHPDSTDNYQVDKAVDAFRHGGVFGTGLGQGTVKLSLPDAHADFVFAVAGEELGLFALILVFLYGYIVLRGLSRAMDSKDMFVILAVAGLMTMFGLQAFINMASAIHLMPTKGMTLPFVSYGGSSLISIGFSMGAVLALTRKQVHTGIARTGLFYRRDVPDSMS